MQSARTNPLPVRQRPITEGRRQDSTLILSLYCPKNGVHLTYSQGKTMDSATTELVRAQDSIHPLTKWEFTALDRACLPLVIRAVWVFDAQLDVGTMKAGLQRLLGHYPHLSGRMRDKTGVHLTNDGVPVTVTDDLSVRAAGVPEVSDPERRFSIEIKPSRITRGTDPPLSVKITRLQDGTVLGIQCSHSCMDGDTFYTMVYNWGRICRQADFTPPALDQALFPTPDCVDKDRVQRMADEYGWKRISRLAFLRLLPLLMTGVLSERTRPFHFSVGALEGIRQRLSADVPCSTNVALSALLTHMLIRLFGHSEVTECVQVTVVNARGRLAGLPSAFVGNASVVVPTRSFSAGASIAEIARVIQQTLEPIQETPSEGLRKLVSLNVNAMEHRVAVIPFDFTAVNSRRPTVFYTNNFSGMHIYDVDFGSGRPASVIPHNLTDQVLIWPAGPVGGGVDVYFTGVPARTIHRLKEGSAWLQEMAQLGQ